MIKISSSGSFNNTFKFFDFLLKRNYLKRLNEYGRKGVEALSSATPVDTGKTAASWSYRIKETQDGASIEWTNSNATKEGIPIVVLLYYGHGTPSGKFVQGRDFITPAIEPVFDEIANNLWKEVERS